MPPPSPLPFVVATMLPSIRLDWIVIVPFSFAMPPPSVGVAAGDADVVERDGARRC